MGEFTKKWGAELVEPPVSSVLVFCPMGLCKYVSTLDEMCNIHPHFVCIWFLYFIHLSKKGNSSINAEQKLRSISMAYSSDFCWEPLDALGVLISFTGNWIKSYFSHVEHDRLGMPGCCLVFCFCFTFQHLVHFFHTLQFSVFFKNWCFVSLSSFPTFSNVLISPLEWI